jgi:hypothetical protein
MIHLPRSQESIAQDHRDRLRRLERQKQTPTLRPERTTEIATFCVVGDMAVSTSPKYTVENGGSRILVRTSASAAGTADTEFDVWVNGSAVGSTVNYDVAEADPQTDDIGAGPVAPGDTLQIDLTAAGMHEGLVIQVVMRG